VTSTQDTQTDIQTTLHVTSVAIGRIYAMHAMRPKIFQTWKIIYLSTQLSNLQQTECN